MSDLDVINPSNRSIRLATMARSIDILSFKFDDIVPYCYRDNSILLYRTIRWDDFIVCVLVCNRFMC